MRTRKIAAWTAAAALALGMVGVGLNAAFTDNATARQDVSVGTFDIALSSAQGVVSPDGSSITFESPKIMSSAAGSAPFQFTVTSNGSIPVRINVSASPLSDALFSDMLGAIPSFDLTQGQSHVFNAGIAWTELDNDNLGQTYSITYTVSATEVPAP